MQEYLLLSHFSSQNKFPSFCLYKSQQTPLSSKLLDAVSFKALWSLKKIQSRAVNPFWAQSPWKTLTQIFRRCVPTDLILLVLLIMFHQSMIIKIKAVGGVGCGCEQREKTFPLPRLSDQQISYTTRNCF